MLVSSTTEGCKLFSADKVDAKDTVGAGDAFLGSLGAYLARGLALEDAVGKAVRCVGVRSIHSVGGRRCSILVRCPSCVIFG